MKKAVFILTIIFMFITLPIFSQDIDFSIRFYNRAVYFTDSQIYIKLFLKNTGDKPYRFSFSDNKVFNVDFDAHSTTNIMLEHSDNYISQKNSNKQVFYRDVTILPGEEYSFVEELGNYIKIDKPGAYVLKALFFPELNSFPNSKHLQSNILTLELRPADMLSKIEEKIDYETREILRKSPLAPDDVVSYMLNARQKSEWNKFFLYMDIESLFTMNHLRKSEYSMKNDADRRMMLKKYKDDLKKENTDQTILVIPRSFNVIHTEYSNTEAKVKAKLKFDYTDFVEIKEYTYYLHRKDGIWYIYNYEVMNLGTE